MRTLQRILLYITETVQDATLQRRLLCDSVAKISMYTLQQGLLCVLCREDYYAYSAAKISMRTQQRKLLCCLCSKDHYVYSVAKIVCVIFSEDYYVNTAAKIII